jgi:methionyl-tRNA formyltransferase
VVHDCRRHPRRTFASVHGKTGDISGATENGTLINAQSGYVEVLRLRPERGKTMGAADFARQRKLAT